MAKKILVVDDEPHILTLLESRLKAYGFSVITASNGTSCLNKAQSDNPDLIILDVMMPELNGFEVCRKLKENKKTKDIPVVMLTVLTQEEDVTKGLAQGAACFLSKPFNPEDLLSEIQTALSDKDKIKA